MVNVSLIQQLEEAGCNVDVDSFVPSVAQSLPFQPHDATSNQALIGLCVYDPANNDLLRTTIQSMPKASPLDVLNTLHAKFGRAQLENISGRVLVQASPRYAYDEEKIVQHAEAYAAAFALEGVARDRFAIKIPTTSAGVRAAKRLKANGIESLGTTLFSVPQAVAASQARMYAISPYYNPCLAHDDDSLFLDVADPATDHTMSSRMLHIRQTYDRLAKESGLAQPQIKGAGFITAREVLAQLELGCDSVTILPAALEDLKACSQIPAHRLGEWGRRWTPQLGDPDLTWSDWIPSPYVRGGRLESVGQTDPLAHITSDFKLARTDIDYLAKGVLDRVNEADEATTFRLADALSTFERGESKLLEYIASLQ